MNTHEIKVGAILENPLRQFAKVIAIKNGVYALSGWTSREHAEKATVAYVHVNSYGLLYANVKVVGAGKAKVKSEPSDDAGSSTAAKAPANKPAVVVAPKSTKGKGGAKKAAGKTSAKKTAKGKK